MMISVGHSPNLAPVNKLNTGSASVSIIDLILAEQSNLFDADIA